MSVSIAAPNGGRWKAIVGERLAAKDDASTVLLRPAAGSTSVCASECTALQSTGTLLLEATIHLVEPASGLAVPAAAVATGADGTTVVVDEAGTRVPVRVSVTAQGWALITGLPEGSRVRVPAVRR